jgi:hypothetical protein
VKYHGTALLRLLKTPVYVAYIPEDQQIGEDSTRLLADMSNNWDSFVA